MTAIVLPDRKFGLLVRLGNTGCLRHCFLYAFRLWLFALRELAASTNCWLPVARKYLLITDYWQLGYCLNGMPMCFNNARAWSSVPAEVTIVMFMPFSFSTLA